MISALVLAGIVYFNGVTPAGGGIAFVQSKASAPCDSNSSTTNAATMDSNVASGAALVVAFTAGGDVCSAATVTDTRSNSYTVATSSYDSTNNQCLGIAYAVNSSAGADTVTVTYGSSVAWRAMAVHEYSGVATASASDGGASNSPGASSSWTSTSITTTVDGDVIVGAVMASDGVTTSHTPGTGFTERVDTHTACWFATEDKVQTTAGSVAADGTFNTSSRYSGSVLALKKA